MTGDTRPKRIPNILHINISATTQGEMPNKITLTPGQAVTIHGWIRARLSLTWGDVLANNEINLHVLLGYNITETSLHQLQPDLQAWIRSKKVRLEDMPRMTLWEPHPIKDLKADLADLARMRWPTDTLAAMHVTVRHSACSLGPCGLCGHPAARAGSSV